MEREALEGNKEVRKEVANFTSHEMSLKDMQKLNGHEGRIQSVGSTQQHIDFGTASDLYGNNDHGPATQQAAYDLVQFAKDNDKGYIARPQPRPKRS